MIEEVEHRIRERAHRIWESEGRPWGRADQHWQMASAEVLSEAVKPARAKAPRKAAAASAGKAPGVTGEIPAPKRRAARAKPQA